MRIDGTRRGRRPGAGLEEHPLPRQDSSQPPTSDTRGGPTDAELVARANTRDPGAFEALYRRHRDWVVALAWRFTRDRELSLDVMQETFLYLLGKFPGFELRGQMKSFLYPVVRHIAISAQSRARRDAPPAVDGAAAGSASFARFGVDEESLSALAGALADLAPGQQEVLILRFADELSLEEIAAALELPLGTVKSRIHNALAALRVDPRTKTYFAP